jgi:hypothetical protein
MPNVTCLIITAPRQKCKLRSSFIPREWSSDRLDDVWALHFFDLLVPRISLMLESNMVPRCCSDSLLLSLSPSVFQGEPVGDPDLGQDLQGQG